MKYCFGRIFDNLYDGVLRLYCSHNLLANECKEYLKIHT